MTKVLNEVGHKKRYGGKPHIDKIDNVDSNFANIMETTHAQWFR